MFTLDMPRFLLDKPGNSPIVDTVTIFHFENLELIMDSRPCKSQLSVKPRLLKSRLKVPGDVILRFAVPVLDTFRYPIHLKWCAINPNPAHMFIN